MAARGRDAALLSAQKRSGGVVHTPVELARGMLREADALLGRHGLPRVGSAALEILDPATGPGVFLAATIAHARGEEARLAGIDVDPAAFAATRAALGRAAEARGWRLSLEVRDALEVPWDGTHGASARLVVGNPPWSARGLGPAFVEALVRDFHRDERGAPLGERRRGVLADAYVRFLRWAADAVERAPGGGALALVTNSSYLDGPVHRGVRAFLTSRFDEVSIVDLGGSALVARAPGAIDQNVFGVRPGAAVLLAARPPRGGARLARVTYRALGGTVEDKLAALAKPREPVVVEEPLASLRPRARTSPEYAGWPSIAEWLPFHAEGVQSNRDALVFDRDRGALLERLERVARGRLELAPRPHFDPREALRSLRALEAGEGFEPHVRPVAYRPLDARWAFLHPSLCHRPRPPLLEAMGASSLALVSVRQDRGGLPWAHAALVAHPIDNCFLSSRSSCRARAFPTHRPDGSPNLAPSVLGALRALGLEPAPRQVLAYLAAVLSSRPYVRAHAPALALDYARVPLPRDRTVFSQLAGLGERLAAGLDARADTVRAGGVRALVRVGHHAFDAEDPAVAALAKLREEIDAVVAATVIGR